jgi:putative transposase
MSLLRRWGGVERGMAGRMGQQVLAIDLRRKACGPGGWRPGAGRKRGRRVSHGGREELSGREPIHVTLRVRPEVARLRRRDVFAVVRRAIAGSHGGGFRVCEFSVMSNHVHLLVEASSKGALSRGVKRLATRMAMRINRRLGRRGSVFADRYHSRLLRCPRQVRGCLIYVLQNLRHHAGGAGGLAFDAFSSAASFSGWAEPLPHEARWMREALEEPPATVPATTWLLASGWRRLGLVRLEESPAVHRVARSRRPAPQATP